MSDYESHIGKVKKVEPLANESFEETCKRLWVENGKLNLRVPGSNPGGSTN